MSHKRYDNILSDYKIIKNLGEGGMGEVFLAQDINLSRQVAIKFLKLDGNPNSEVLIKRFQNEAKILASLNHPNIVSIYNFGTKDKINYIVMEYVSGMNLHEAIKAKRFDLVESTKIIKRIVRGMSEAHNKGVLHRDIKPANIIVNSKREVKIVDFGISKSLLNDESNFTKDNHFIGTVSYMAPEIFRGEEPSPQSDIFSIGILFYEMLTGFNPFVSENKFKTIEKIKTTQIVLPPQIKNKIPEMLNKIFNKMVAIDKKNRYQSSNEIYQDLRNLRGESGEKQNEVDSYDYVLEEGLENDVIKNIMESSQPLVLEDAEELNFSEATVSFERGVSLSLNKSLKKEKNIKDSTVTSWPRHQRKSRFSLSNAFFVMIAAGSLYHYSVGKWPDSFKNVISSDLILSYVMGFKSYNIGDSPLTEEVPIASPQKRGVASVSKDEAYLEFPQAGSQFTYETVTINEKTGQVFRKLKETYILNKPNRGIASIDIESSNSNKKEVIKVTANNFLPPFEFTDASGELTKLKISGNYNSIYPLATGKTMEFTAVSLHKGGSFFQMSQECKVLGEENINLKGNEYQTYVVKCVDVNQSKPSETWTYYSPQLKQFVKREKRKFHRDGYHLETINLVNYKLNSKE